MNHVQIGIPVVLALAFGLVALLVWMVASRDEQAVRKGIGFGIAGCLVVLALLVLLGVFRVAG